MNPIRFATARTVAFVLGAAVLCPAALFSEEPEPFLDRIERLLGSEDPAERQEGAAALADAAEEMGDELNRLLRHPDPEVSRGATDVLTRNGLFLDAADRAEARRLFAVLEDAASDTGAKKKALRTFLAIGSASYTRLNLQYGAPQPEVLPPAVSMDLQALQNGVLVRHPRELSVVHAGKTEFVVTIRALASDRTGWWHDPSCVGSSTNRDRLGAVPSRQGLGVPAGAIRLNSTAPPRKVSEEWMLNAMSRRTRIPPGKEFDVLQVPVAPDANEVRTICVWDLGGIHAFSETDKGRLEILFDERALVWHTNVVCLPGTTGTGFQVKSLRDGESVLLEVTSRGPHEAPECDAYKDCYWWVAEGRNGKALGHGPMRRTHHSEPLWSEGETRRIRLETPLPPETQKLWLGFDARFSDVRGPDEQYVATPLELMR